MTAPARRDHAVFINCPYDGNFKGTFRAIVLAILCCGFVPRTAASASAVSTLRFLRIQAGLRDCRYSVHDLSRCHGEGTKNLSRFNMPLELGIAMGQRYEHGDAPGFHDWLVLAPERFNVDAYISDLRGFNLRNYKSTPEDAALRVMYWLGSQDKGLPRPPLQRDEMDRVVTRGLAMLKRRAHKELADNDDFDEGWRFLHQLCADVARELALGVSPGPGTARPTPERR